MGRAYRMLLMLLVHCNALLTHELQHTADKNDKRGPDRDSNNSCCNYLKKKNPNMSFSMASLNLRSRASKHKHKTPRILRTDPVWMEKLFFFFFFKNDWRLTAAIWTPVPLAELQVLGEAEFKCCVHVCVVKLDKPRTTKTNCEVNANGTQQEKKN